jgi:hypothetical protein
MSRRVHPVESAAANHDPLPVLEWVQVPGLSNFEFSVCCR